MKLVIEIDLENDAFQGDLANEEIANILQRLVRDYQRGTAIERPLRDVNGNTVGHVGIQG